MGLSYAIPRISAIIVGVNIVVVVAVIAVPATSRPCTHFQSQVLDISALLSLTHSLARSLTLLSLIWPHVRARHVDSVILLIAARQHRNRSNHHSQLRNSFESY